MPLANGLEAVEVGFLNRQSFSAIFPGRRTKQTLSQIDTRETDKPTESGPITMNHERPQFDETLTTWGIQLFSTVYFHSFQVVPTVGDGLGPASGTPSSLRVSPCHFIKHAAAVCDQPFERIVLRRFDSRAPEAHAQLALFLIRLDDHQGRITRDDGRPDLRSPAVVGHVLEVGVCAPQATER